MRRRPRARARAVALTPVGAQWQQSARHIAGAFGEQRAILARAPTDARALAVQPTLSTLTAVRNLAVDRNQLNGTLPRALFNAMTSLTSLQLFGNLFGDDVTIGWRAPARADWRSSFVLCWRGGPLFQWARQVGARWRALARRLISRHVRFRRCRQRWAVVRCLARPKREERFFFFDSWSGRSFRPN